MLSHFPLSAPLVQSLLDNFRMLLVKLETSPDVVHCNCCLKKYSF